jgi:hypothetical protein
MENAMMIDAGTNRARCKLVGAAVSLAILLNLLPSSVRAEKPNTVKCSLQKSSENFTGSCTVPCSVNNLAIDIDGVNPRRSCDRPDRVVQASLTPMPGNKWLGTMQGKEPEDPTRFELIQGKDGVPAVAKLPYGWFRLAEARIVGNDLLLTIEASRTLAPTPDDIRILERTRLLLWTDSVWNREDNRKCPSNPSKWSLFCALTQATAEVSGGVHYRQPALQTVREVLNEVDGGRIRLHRLMEYNNDPQTSLDDIYHLLEISKRRLEKHVSTN